MRNAVKLAVGEMGSRIPLMLLELILARLLGPAIYGVWSIVQTFATYGNFLQLGVASSLARREPGLIERGAHDEIRAYRAAAYGLQFMVVGGLVVVILGLSVTVEGVFDAIGGLTMALALLLVILMQQITITTQASAVNEYKFMETSISRLAYAFSFLIVGLIVVRFEPPLLWLTIGWAASLLVALVLLHVITRSVLPLPAIDLVRTVLLLRDGFPFMLQGLLRFGLVSIDKVVVFSVMRPEVVGYYALGSLASSVTGLIGTMISRVSLPTLLRIDERNGGIDLLQVEFERMVSLIQVLNYGALITICFFSPILVHFLLPSYKPATQVIGILAIAGGFTGMAQAMSDVAMSLRVKAAVLVNTSSTMVVQALLLTLAWKLGAGIEGIAVSVLTAMALMSARGSWLAMDAVGIKRCVARRRLCGSAITAVVAVLACLAALELQIESLKSMTDAPIGTLSLNLLVIALISVGMLVAIKRIRQRSDDDREGNE